MSKDGVPVWKTPVNNGTDLWEANLRNGGQPPPQQQAKTPWGHTPATNIGGTWGEDDEAADSSNMWTGAPTSSQPNSTAGQWTTGAGNQTGTWGGNSGLVSKFFLFSPSRAFRVRICRVDYDRKFYNTVVEEK